MQNNGRNRPDARKLFFQKYEPIILVALNNEKQSVTILDNGSGMNLEILKKYFLNVGVSYYNSDAYKLQGREYVPIGHYGIGFLSCFMLSDKVEVRTKHIEENQIIKIEFAKNSEYICLIYENKTKTQGTEIVLDYEQFMIVFPNGISEIKSFIEDKEWIYNFGNIRKRPSRKHIYAI